MGRLDEVNRGEWAGKWKTTKSSKKRKLCWTVESARTCCFEKCDEKLSNFVKQLWPNGSSIMPLSQVEDAFANTRPSVFTGDDLACIHEINIIAWCPRIASIHNVFTAQRTLWVHVPHSPSPPRSPSMHKVLCDAKPCHAMPRHIMPDHNNVLNLVCV